MKQLLLMLTLIAVVTQTSCNAFGKKEKTELESVVYEIEAYGNPRIFHGQVDKNGMLQGPAKEYNLEGELVMESNFVDNLPDEKIILYEDGVVRRIISMNAGIIEGFVRSYFPCGNVESVNYIKDSLNHFIKRFDQDGNVLEYSRFANSVLWGFMGSNINCIEYSFIDPYFKSGYMMFYFLDTLGNLLNQEKVIVNSTDAVICSGPQKPGLYKVVYELHDDGHDSTVFRAKSNMESAGVGRHPYTNPFTWLIYGLK